ncbi:MAG: ABC transporter permease [Candidatus Bipolaricaulia bacterium]
MRAFWAFLGAQLRIFIRDRLDFFLTLGLPILFLLIFGFIWGGEEKPTRLGIVLLGSDEPVLSVLQARPNLVLERFPAADLLEEAVRNRAVDFGLLWDGTKLSFIFEAGRIQDNSGYEQLARGIASALELKLQGKEAIVIPEKVHLGRLAGARWFHLVIPGIIALPILSAGLFAIAGRITAMRERRILAQLLVTPLPSWALLSSLGLLRLGVAYVGAFATLAFATIVFGLRFPIQWGLFVPFVAACGLGAMGMGALIAFLVRRPGSASFAANIFLQLMLFLSGIYFPLEFLPPFLRVVSRGLPLTHMAQGMRYALGVVEMPPSAFWGMTAGFTLFGLGFVPLLARYITHPGQD